MAVSTDTIQTLLRQRQDLREALLDLRKEIESLDASSLDLVNRNIKSPAPATTAPATPPPPSETSPVQPAPVKTAGNAEKPETPETPKSPEKPEKPETSETPEKAEAPVVPVPDPPTAAEDTIPAPAAASDAPTPEKDTAPPPETSRREPVLTPSARPAEQTSAPADPPASDEAEKPKADPPAAPPAAATEGAGEEEDDDDLAVLLEKARALSDYLLDHPSKLPPAELGALDAAITVSAAASTPAEKKACYHTLQAAYRKISAATFAASGVNGTTLQDSAAGAPLLWAIPLSISILIIMVFPLLLLARHLSGEMFTDEFAADLIWSFGLLAAFLWGTVGALSLLTLNIGLAVRYRRFDGGVRYSPGLRGALGGLTGAVFFMIVETELPMSDATADFALDMAAFIGGLLSSILFAGLQRALNAVTGWLAPRPKSATGAKPPREPKK